MTSNKCVPFSLTLLNIGYQTDIKMAEGVILGHNNKLNVFTLLVTN